MRRIVVALMGALLFGSVLGPDANAAPNPYADAAGGAFADASAAWIVLDHHGGGVFYFAEGVRQAWAPDGVQSVAFVARGRCRSVHSKRVSFIVCEATAQPHPVSLDQFRMDPLLRSAALDVRLKGNEHRVRWTAVGDPGAGESAAVGPGWASTGAGVSRWAEATGSLFGHRLRRGRFSMAYLATSVLGYAFAAPGTSLHRHVERDGAMRVRYRARVSSSSRT